MPPIIRYVRQLEARPAEWQHPAAHVRTYLGEQDIEPWLAIRNAAFAFLRGRPWTATDFRREFLAQPWWPAATLWFAEVGGDAPTHTSCNPDAPGRSRGLPVGTLLLAPAERPAGCAILRWLAVHPAWQRQGIARLLVRQAEMAAWDTGWHNIVAETHARWQAAVALYTACGYTCHPAHSAL